MTRYVVASYPEGGDMEFKFINAASPEDALIKAFDRETFESLYEDFDDGEGGSPDYDMMLEELFNQGWCVGVEVIPKDPQGELPL